VDGGDVASGRDGARLDLVIAGNGVAVGTPAETSISPDMSITPYRKNGGPEGSTPA